MDVNPGFALTISKKSTGAWQTVAEGHWEPPAEPVLTGAVLPGNVVAAIGAINPVVYGQGGYVDAHDGDWVYRIDLVRKKAAKSASAS